MKRSIFGLLLLAGALPLHAQLGRRPVRSSEPGYWVGLSYGYVEGLALTDRDTRGDWQFSYASQLRATLEKTVQPGVTVGAAAGFANANLSYRDDGLATSCAVSCRASADVTQYLAFIRRSGGPGFHSLVDLEAGVTRFSNFRERTSGDELPPTHVSNDFTFGLGFGFGYGFSPIASVYAIQQFDFVMHPQNDEVTTSSAPRLFNLRAGFRVGF